MIGNRNFIMESVHISHDTVIGNGCVFGYGTKIAGNCDIHDCVIFSSGVIANPGSTCRCSGYGTEWMSFQS